MSDAVSAAATPHPGAAAFTEAEMEHLRTVVYPSLPSFHAEDWSIASADVRALMQGVRDCTNEQHAGYRAYWDEHFGGRVPWAAIRPIFEFWHDSAAYLRAFVGVTDKHGDGYIHKDDFKLFFEIFERQHVGYPLLSWEEFVAQADTNHDGRVSIEEAAVWVDKQK